MSNGTSPFFSTDKPPQEIVGVDNFEQVPVHREVHKVIIIQRPAFRTLSDCQGRDGPQKLYHATSANQHITDLKASNVPLVVMRRRCVHLMLTSEYTDQHSTRNRPANSSLPLVSVQRLLTQTNQIDQMNQTDLAIRWPCISSDSDGHLDLRNSFHVGAEITETGRH